MTTDPKKRFDSNDISVKYAKFRPVYPPNVSDIIISYMMKSKGNVEYNVALDVGCGSGQSTFLLCNSFKKVIGLDISKTQLEQAKLKCADSFPQVSNVEFIEGDAHNLPIETSSVDLVTCGAAWHWLNPDLFYAETKRVLKQRGCLAIYGYGMRVNSNKRIQKAFDTFIDELFQNDCFSEQNLHPLNNYEAVILPYSNTQRIDYDFPQSSTIDQVIGLFSSVSMYTTYCRKFPNNTLLQRIREVYESESDKCDIEQFNFPGYVILGTN